MVLALILATIYWRLYVSIDSRRQNYARPRNEQKRDITVEGMFGHRGVLWAWHASTTTSGMRKCAPILRRLDPCMTVGAASSEKYDYIRVDTRREAYYASSLKRMPIRGNLR
jgi:hypothetical protein